MPSGKTDATSNCITAQKTRQLFNEKLTDACSLKERQWNFSGFKTWTTPSTKEPNAEGSSLYGHINISSQVYVGESGGLVINVEIASWLHQFLYIAYTRQILSDLQKCIWSTPLKLNSGTRSHFHCLFSLFPLIRDWFRSGTPGGWS